MLRSVSHHVLFIDTQYRPGLNLMPGPDEKMGSVSQLLVQVREQDDDAKRQLFTLIYEELRNMAGAVLRGDGANRSLRATELVHEAVLRLLDPAALDRAHNRRYLYSACCRAMRQILVDHSRIRNADKRGGAYQRHDFDVVLDEFNGRAGGDFAALNVELDELEQSHPRLAEVVHCRFFGGMSVLETAELLAVSEKTVHRDWRLAKAMLKKALAD
jgi:RNA polymerase sigma-70 factor (ECF subfamily)